MPLLPRRAALRRRRIKRSGETSTSDPSCIYGVFFARARCFLLFPSSCDRAPRPPSPDVYPLLTSPLSLSLFDFSLYLSPAHPDAVTLRLAVPPPRRGQPARELGTTGRGCGRGPALARSERTLVSLPLFDCPLRPPPSLLPLRARPRSSPLPIPILCSTCLRIPPTHHPLVARACCRLYRSPSSWFAAHRLPPIPHPAPPSLPARPPSLEVYSARVLVSA